jgi:hypothetical protein
MLELVDETLLAWDTDEKLELVETVEYREARELSASPQPEDAELKDACAWRDRSIAK